MSNDTDKRQADGSDADGDDEGPADEFSGESSEELTTEERLGYLRVYFVRDLPSVLASRREIERLSTALRELETGEREDVWIALKNNHGDETLLDLRMVGIVEDVSPASLKAQERDERVERERHRWDNDY
jgi:hypothetical protein